MATAKQELGALGERLVVQHCACPRCKRARTLRTLPANFKCADIICDFCGYLGQVKAHSCADGTTPPPKLLGAAWGPQQQRMEAGIYFPLFLVLVAQEAGRFSIQRRAYEAAGVRFIEEGADAGGVVPPILRALPPN